MKIVEAFPPNYEKLKEVFKVDKDVLFAYGDTIYNPFKFDLSKRPDLIAHEEVHERQQGNDVEGWWKKYIEDPKFRAEQEIEAYGLQVKFIRQMAGPEFAAKAIQLYSKSLAGPIYGGAISEESAVYQISKYSKK